MRGRSLIFVAIILPAGALAQDSALDAITHEETDLRAESRKLFALSDGTDLAAFPPPSGRSPELHRLRGPRRHSGAIGEDRPLLGGHHPLPEDAAQPLVVAPGGGECRPSGAGGAGRSPHRPAPQSGPARISSIQATTCRTLAVRPA